MSGAEIARYVAKRLLFSCVAIVAISVVVFALIHLTPGDPEHAVGIASPQNATPAFFHQLRQHFGLDKPITTQLLTFFANASHLDFGLSYRTNQSALSLVVARMGVTGPLFLLSAGVALVCGIAMAGAAAFRRGDAVDRGSQNAAIFMLSAPAFAVGTILLYCFAVSLGWFPVLGEGTGVMDRFWHLALPSITLGLTGVAVIFKNLRSHLLTILEQDYVTFARSRGFSRATLLRGFVLRNALVTLITTTSVMLVGFISTSVIVEITFGLDGVGSLLADSILHEDIPVVQAITFLLALFIVGLNLVTDLLYFAVDPRIRAEEARA
ncbi:MAG TPA: ABC transporter permease [Conexibacter sp.]|jgi:peptide/nickel transport system permease protein|nr:ABC transporter permease [Conexibacter sp.]